MKRVKAIGLPVLLLLAGCMKDELPVPAKPRGDARELQVCMGFGYQEQVWMDLSSGEVLRTNVKTAWDLSFESAPEGWRIMLNGARLMTAWDIGDVDMALPMDTGGMGAGRRIDAPSGHPDSTAFGDWRGTGHVHVLGLGYDAMGRHLGFRKVRPLSVGASGYTLETARLDGTEVTTITVPKDPSRSEVHFSFANGVVQIAPPRGEWDLVFTQYTHQFYEPFVPYIVSGVLIDHSTMRVAQIPDADFEGVTLEDTLRFPFGSRRDIIGYRWKEYSFDTNRYIVDDRIVYIVKDAKGFFHKMHFLDFYNDMGQVGCPLFEVKPL